MKLRALTACLLLFCLFISARAHDLFLKFDTYFLPANSKATVRLFNGTFHKSEGVVKKERLNDVSLVDPSGAFIKPSLSSWRGEGETTLLDLNTGAEGSYIIAVSTKPNFIELKADKFNDYLEHDGLPDTLEERKKNGGLKKDARERYSKHVKALVQVGDGPSDSYKTRLGYPVEIVPLQNPYALKSGDVLDTLILKDGKPIANQFVVAGWEGSNGSSNTFSLRANSEGIARIEIKSPGRWYVKMIHMTKLNEPALDYESFWASLTFEIK